MTLRLTTLICAALLVCSTPLRAQWAELHYVDPGLHWRTLETEHFLIHFAEHNRAQSRTVAAIAERVYLHTTALLDWRPRLRTHIVIMDSADFANGFATPVPFNLNGIFLSPPDDGELLQNRDWLELVLSHEFFHIVHLDKASGEPLQLRSVLGRLLFFFPNVLQPTWVIEGLAVYNESDPPRGYGRLYNSYFNGMMRAEVARGLRSLREVNAEGRGFPLNRDYLYGSYFFAFLRERYGDSAMRQFIDHYSANVVPFRVQSNAATVTGKEMDALWVEYHRWLRERFVPADALPLAGDELVHAFSVSSPVLAHDGTRWYVQADGYTRPKLMRQVPGAAPSVVRATESDTRLAAAGVGVLMAEQDICREHNLLYNLHYVDSSGARRTISQCERHRFAAVMSPERIAAVRVDGGIAEVVVLENGRPVRSLYRAGAGESVSGIAASGEHVVITAVRAGVWALLDVSDGTPKVLVADEAIKHSPRFGRTPDEVFFVADYGKRYDLWSWDRSTASLARWTRAPYGVREISDPVAGELLLTTIEADGVTLRQYRLPAEPLERRSLQGAPAVVPPVAEPKVAADDRPYSPWPSLRPTAWVPLLQIADGAIAAGAVVYGTDALQLHEYYLAPMIEFTQGELLGRAEYTYDGRHGVVLNRDMIVRQSEGGSHPKIKAYSIKQNGQWVSLWRSLELNRRWYWGFGAAIDEETFHDVTLGSTSVRNERVAGLLAGIDTRRQQLLSEGQSEGQELRLFAETSRGLGAAYTGNAYRADWRGDLPLGRTVLALRWNEAYGQRDAQPYELGGSDSDEVILLPILNQRTFALRGYTTGTPSLTGHHARVASIEWRTPLSDIDRHFMVPPVGMNRVSLNLFADIGAAWEHGNAPDYHRGIGAELISEPRVGYIFGTTLRAGIARGVDPTGSTRIYLRVGRAF